MANPLTGIAALLLAAPLLSGPLSAAPARSEETDLVIVFDTSGSMNDAVQGGRKLDIAKKAVWGFISGLPKNVNLGLVAFNGGCGTRTVQALRRSDPKNRAQLQTAVAGLRGEGSTPIGDSLRRAVSLLADSPRKKRIVIMTDGEDTCDEGLLAQTCDEAWKKGIKVYAVGFAFGQMPSRNFRKIGIYKDANDPAQLASVFTEIRKSLERESGRFDEFKDPALSEAPPVSRKGRWGRFTPGGERGGKLFKTLQLNSSYEHRFTAADRFEVLEHGYHILFNEQEYTVDKVEVYRVRLEEKVNFVYGGAEGFVFAQDAAID